MSTRTAGVTLGRSPTRCPYCHDSVDLETPWVACRACLARHHGECWADVGVCAACGVATCLADDRAGPPVHDSAREAEEAFATAELLERLESPPPVRPHLAMGPLEYVGSLLTLGLLPALLAEHRLIQHAEEALARDRVARPLKGKPRPRPERRTAAAARRRRARTAGVFGLALFAALAGAMAAGGRQEGLGVLLSSLAGLGWVVTLLVELACHHRAVRQHEAAQLAATVRSQQLDTATTYRLVTRHEEAWARSAGALRRGAGVSVLLSTICFPVVWLPLPLWAARAFEVPLEQHRRRERLGELRW